MKPVDILANSWYPNDDFQPTADVLGYYQVKYATVAAFRPKSICELGVRAGYSALMFLLAAPEAEYLGIDNREGEIAVGARYMEHAERLLAGYNARCMTANSRDLAALPRTSTGQPFEFVHVDGDHSYAGCLHDLRLAAGARWVLVDDYEIGREIQQACGDYLREHPHWLPRAFSDPLKHGSLLLVRP